MVYYSNKIPHGDVEAEGRRFSCHACTNDITSAVKWFIDGPWVGFMGVPLVGKKKYFHVCPICGEFLEALTKAQVDALKMR